MLKSFTILYLDEQSLKKFFNFLKVDSSISDPLIVTTLSEIIFSAILNFLENENLIF